MEKIKITFIGTGDSIPTKKRNHTAILVGYKNENILIDCGEGTQRQFKMAEISPTKLTKVLLTHWHGDHILGLPGLFQTLYMNNYNKTLEVYGPKETKYFIDLLKNFVNIQIHLLVREISGTVVETPEYIIKSLPMSHGIPNNGYSLEIKSKIRLDKKKLKKLKLPNSPLLKQLQQGKSISFRGKTISPKQVSYFEKGKKVTFILDTAFNKNAIDLAKDSDILIIESSFSSEEKERAAEYKHLTSTQAAEIAKKAKVKSLVLTHISQRYDKDQSIILQEAKKIFKNTKIVKDFESIEI